jgi:hypothetical protein
MADLDDIHHDLTIGNLSAAASLRQRQAALQKQEEIAALLRSQKQEQDRVKQLPQCPQCGARVETVAKICASCRTPLLILADVQLQDALPYFVALTATNVQHELVDVFRKVQSHENKLVGELHQQGASLQRACQQMSIALQPPVSGHIATLGNAVAGETRARNFWPTFFRVGLGFLLWLGSLWPLSQIAGELSHRTVAILFFIAVPLTIAVLFHLLFHSHRGRARAEALEGLRKCFATNPSLRNLLDGSSATGEQVQHYLDSLVSEAESAHAKYDNLLGRLFSCSKVKERLRAFAASHKVTVPQGFLVQDKGVLCRLPALAGDSVEAIGISAGEIARAIRQSLGMAGDRDKSTEGPLNGNATSSGVRSESLTGSGGQLWLRSSSGKVSGPYTRSQVASAVSIGKIPDDTKAALSPDGPWQVIKKRKSE